MEEAIEAFEQLKVANVEDLEIQHRIEQQQKKAKVKAKAPATAAKPQPQAKAPTAAEIRNVVETTKAIDAAANNKNLLPLKGKLISKISRYCEQFALQYKPPKVSLSTSVEELQHHVQQIEHELNSRGAFAHVCNLFLSIVGATEQFNEAANPIGLRLSGLQHSVMVNMGEFKPVLTELAIKHDLMNSGPEMRLLALFAMAIKAQHDANVGFARTATATTAAAEAAAADPKYEDL